MRRAALTDTVGVEPPPDAPNGSLESAVCRLGEAGRSLRALAAAGGERAALGAGLADVSGVVDEVLAALGRFVELRRQEAGPTSTFGWRAPGAHFLAAVLRAARVGLFSWDPRRGSCWYSEEWKANLGLDGGATGHGTGEWASRTHPEDLAACTAAARDLALGRTGEVSGLLRMCRSDGAWRWFRVHAASCRDERGRVVRVDGCLLDVEELVTAREEAARARAERAALTEALRREHEAMPMACVLIAPDLTILEWNRAAEVTFGWAAEEAIGRKVTRLAVLPESERRIEAHIDELFRSGRVGGGVSENVTRDGRRLRCEWSDIPLLDGDGHPFAVLAMGRDVTEEERTKARLAASERRLRHLVECLPVAMAVVGRDGAVERVNLRTTELFGWTKEELPTARLWVDATLSEPGLREEALRAARAHRRAARAGSPAPPTILDVTARSGERRRVAFACVALEDVDVWTFTDLTGLVRLEAERRLSEERTGLLLDLARRHEASEGELVDVALGGAVRLTGSATGEIRFIEEGGAHGPRGPAEGGGGSAGEQRLSVRVRGAEGEVVLTGTVAGKPDPYDPEDERTLQVVMNELWAVVAHRRAESALGRMKVELEERVRVRTARLEEANRALESFASSISHDLRAPLRSIDGFGEILAEEHGERLGEEGRRLLARIRDGARRMGCLVDDLLRLSRLSRAELRSEEVDVSALAAQIGAELAEADPGRVVRLDIAPDLRARGDQALLRVLLENLLRNAWKFTSRRAEAHVAVGRVGGPHAGGFFVRDDGAGFDPARAEELFRPFRRLHSSEEFEGSGVGLATVDLIVRRHGGRVEAEGRPGRGATFRFFLPDTGFAP